MNSLLILLAISAATAKPIDVAYLVNEKDPAAIVEPLRVALTSPDPLVRTTAARVAGVRDEKTLAGDLRKAAEQESDASAAREELRSIALLGAPEDVDYAIGAAAKWPASVDNDVAQAIARRGGNEPIDFYITKLKGARTLARADFFRQALWGRPAAMTVTASRLAGINDEPGWLAFLGVMRDSNMAVAPGVIAASFDSPSEGIRVASVWHVVNTYAAETTLPQPIHDAVATGREDVSMREAFGRELVRRIGGFDKRENEKWIEWLESNEADHLLHYASNAVEALLTDREYTVRQKRCGSQPVSCDMPAKKPSRGVYPPKAVAPAALRLPGELPAGTSEALGHCRDWLGLAGVVVDTAGRVQTVDFSKMGRTGCLRQIETMLRLSYATNTSVMSPVAMPDVVLAHAAGDALCLDEDPPSNDAVLPLSRSGGEVVAPVKIHSVDPVFPVDARRAMSTGGGGASSIIILEAVITKHGCVRSVRPLAQSPFGELNGAAIYAMSQWKFSPGLLNGKPVDVIYNMTVHFKLTP